MKQRELGKVYTHTNHLYRILASTQGGISGLVPSSSHSYFRSVSVLERRNGRERGTGQMRTSPKETGVRGCFRKIKWRRPSATTNEGAQSHSLSSHSAPFTLLLESCRRRVGPGSVLPLRDDRGRHTDPEGSWSVDTREGSRGEGWGQNTPR